MCLIVFAWNAHPAYELVLVANRDEYLDRPSQPLAFWCDRPNVLGGRDTEKGGSWFATNIDGRWAAVTNYRDGDPASPSNLSRGHLVSDYVASRERARDYARRVIEPLGEYPSCNLLVGDRGSLYFVSNRWQARRSTGAERVSPGVHGLSNHLLDTPWPKVQRIKRAMGDLMQAKRDLDEDQLFGLLADRTLAEDHELPSTGVPHEWERILSAPFIVADGYGTRASTVVLVAKEGTVRVCERSFGGGGTELDRRAVEFKRGEGRESDWANAS